MVDFVTAAIAVVSITTSLGITHLLERFKISTRMKEIQKFTGKVNKEYFKALKDKDTKRLDELEPELQKSQKMSMESMGLSMKSMAIVLPVAFVLPQLMVMLFPSFIITLPFDLPVPSRDLFDLANLISWRDTFGARGWYWITFIFLGGITQLIVGQVRNRLKKPEEKAPEATSKPQ